MDFVIIIKQAIRYAAVLLYGSTGETLIEKSGHLNLGVPGIMCLGAVGGCMGARWAFAGGMDKYGIIFVAIIMAMLFGAIGGVIYGVFTITLRCNQNVTGLTLTTFGAGVLGFWKSQMGSAGMTYAFSRPARLAFVSPFFGEVGSDAFSTMFLSQGALVYLAIAIAIIVAVALRFTRKGLALRAIGENPAAADAAGINVIGYKYFSCIMGAAIAGIGGASYILDCTAGTLELKVEALGWLAVALVIFSLWRPSIGIFGSFVFGFLYVLPQYVTSVQGSNGILLEIIPYGATALVLVVISFFNKKETQPPAALGLPYFREDR